MTKYCLSGKGSKVYSYIWKNKKHIEKQKGFTNIQRIYAIETTTSSEQFEAKDHGRFSWYTLVPNLQCNVECDVCTEVDSLDNVSVIFVWYTI